MGLPYLASARKVESGKSMFPFEFRVEKEEDGRAKMLSPQRIVLFLPVLGVVLMFRVQFNDVPIRDGKEGERVLY